jgi:hypothetical protein
MDVCLNQGLVFRKDWTKNPQTSIFSSDRVSRFWTGEKVNDAETQKLVSRTNLIHLREKDPSPTDALRVPLLLLRILG